MIVAFVTEINSLILFSKIKTFESSEYGRWRKSGIAFAPRQASYLAPNRTLASPRYFSNRVASGDLGGSVLIGYWGDIVCSPYLAFGTTTERSKELSRTLPGGKQVYGASVISEVNLRCLLWEIQNGMPAPSSIASVNYGLYTPQSNNYDGNPILQFQFRMIMACHLNLLSL